MNRDWSKRFCDDEVATTPRKAAINAYKDAKERFNGACKAFAAHHIDADALERYRDSLSQAEGELVRTLIEIGEINLD